MILLFVTWPLAVDDAFVTGFHYADIAPWGIILPIVGKIVWGLQDTPPTLPPLGVTWAIPGDLVMGIVSNEPYPYPYVYLPYEINSSSPKSVKYAASVLYYVIL